MYITNKNRQQCDLREIEGQLNEEKR